MQIPRRTDNAAFTMVEMLVVIFILLILLSIFVPYGLHLREQSRRAHCADNLRLLFGALANYARDNGSMFPRTIYDPQAAASGFAAFTGANSSDPFAADSQVAVNDVTAAYWLLLRIGYLTDSRVFVCLGGDESADPGRNPKSRSNFASPRNLSYSFATPYSSNPEYKLTSDLPADFVLAADLNPGSEVDDSPAQQSEMNSRNHRGAGQNVLYAYGEVKFQPTPACAINRDNIYALRERLVPATAPATTTTTVPATAPAASLPLIFNHSPADTTDVYLVPKRSR